MKKFIAFISMVLSAVTLFAFTACGGGNSSDLENVKKSGKLVVGVTVYDPMDYIGDDGEWTGFDAELAEEFAQKLGVTAQLVIINWNNKVAELKSNNIDLIWNGMTASEELGKEIDFSVSYAENKQVAVIKKSNESAINSVETVKAASIAVEQGSAGDTVTTETLSAAKINRVERQIDALLEVKSGASDVAIIDYTMAYSLIGKGDYEDLMIVDTDEVSFEREIFAVGLRKGSDLKAELDTFLKGKFADGSLTALAQKYEGVALNEEALKG